MIQDITLSPLGKPILLKGDDVLLMRLLLKVLSDIAPKTLHHFPQNTYVQTLIHHFGPTDTIHSEPTDMIILLPQPKI